MCDVMHLTKMNKNIFKNLSRLQQAAFDERVKIFSTWESAQSTLAKKREAKNKATAQGKAERVAQCEEDIKFVSLFVSTFRDIFDVGDF